MIRSLLATCCVLVVLANAADARTRLKNICRVKGQEENVLSGFGLVVGLNGTGAANDPMTMQALAQVMANLHNPINANGQPGSLDELRKIKNVALVLVNATIPATGARRGDKIDCYISALNGKSLAGGRLILAGLQGPNILDPRLYANCQGQVIIDDPEQPMVGVIPGGCQMEADIFTPFVKDGCITLVLEQNHANFYTAALIAGEIERKLNYSQNDEAEGSVDMVHAKDAANIIVRIPQAYSNDPVDFASLVLETSIDEHEPESKVVINSRAGSIVIDGAVEIGDVAVTHKNISVEAAVPEPFSGIDFDKSGQPRLQQLIDQLNALRVPTADIIDIIRGIERAGKLHGKLIVE
jgi:flagellar P-ring protein precursor FlgI